jgi:formate hydrogenlyase transcriptional activator
MDEAKTSDLEIRELFRKYTLCISSSLEIEKALWRSLLLLRDYIPADELILSVYDPATSFVEIVTTVVLNGEHIPSLTYPASHELQEVMKNPGRHDLVRIVPDSQLDHIAGPIVKARELPPSSMMMARLMVENSHVGGLFVRVTGRNRYTQEHAKIFSIVMEPTAIALENSKRYRELLILKDLLIDHNKYLQEELRPSNEKEIIGAEFGLKEVMNKVRRVAPLPSPVLLLGKTGTGKEVIASAIHDISKRKDGPFIKVNCGAIPESLIDSELFGHEKGAFTNAVSKRSGRFERAHGGTIFLDEIGELSLQAQTRLLRVLQEKELERVGGTGTIKIDVRIIAATNRDLAEMVAARLFREDLFFRINVFPIVIPPVCERKEDIPTFVQYFLMKKAKEMGLRKKFILTPGTMDRLIAYQWPGNVREIQNVIERAVILSHGEHLSFEDIITPHPHVKLSNHNLEHSEGEDLKLDDWIAIHIKQALNKANGRIEGKDGVADLLGINPSTLRHKMRKLGIPYGQKAMAE